MPLKAAVKVAVKQSMGSLRKPQNQGLRLKRNAEFGVFGGCQWKEGFMKQRYFSLAALVLLVSFVCAVYTTAQETEVTGQPAQNNGQAPHNEGKLQEMQTKILQSVQRQVDLLKENLIDIVSREEATSDSLISVYDNKEKSTIKTRSILSDYRISFQQEATAATPDCGVVAKILNPEEPPYILREERTVLSEKETAAIGPLEKFFFNTARTGFLELIVPFDRQYEKCFDYKLLGIAKINDRNTLVLEVKGKESSMEKGVIKKDITTEEELNKEMFTEGLKSHLVGGGADLLLGSTRAIAKREDGIISTKVDMSWNIKFGGLALIDAEAMEIFQFNSGMSNISTVLNTYETEFSSIDKINLIGALPNGAPGVLLTIDREGAPVRSTEPPFANRIKVRNDFSSSRSFLVQTEYDKVKIKGRLLTLPVVRTVNVFRRSLDPETLEFTDKIYLEETYKTMYGSYRAFDVDTKITFDTLDDSSK